MSKADVPQLVDVCIECGKSLLKKPTLLDVKEEANVIILCHECYAKLKLRIKI